MSKLRIALVLVIALTVAAACSSSSPTPTPTPTQTSPTATPVATATPAPTPTAAPSPTPSATPIVAIPNLGEIAIEYVNDLAGGLGSRDSATDLELAAAEYIVGELESLGYEVETQEFVVQRISRERPFVIMTGPDEEELDSTVLNLTASGDSVASLVAVGLGAEQDFPDEGLGGEIALIERGEFTFEEKVQNAQAAGASAVVIYNNEPGELFGTLTTPSEIPVVSVSQADGDRLLGTLEEGEVILDVSISRTPFDSRNVIATKQGTGPGVVVVGAHFDTVPGSVGANDNASGTAVLLTLAGELRDADLPISVTFVAFGSEELGLIGSSNYVRNLLLGEAGTTLAMINLDTIGSGLGLIVGGDQFLTTAALTLADQMGIDLSPGREPTDAASDHAVFNAVGINSIFLLGRDFSRINSPEDTLEFIDPDLLGDAANISLALIYAIAGQ